MGSYMMHICISQKVREKHGLSGKYIYGSILPDIVKYKTKNRDLSHYIKEVVQDNEIRNLPDIKEAINTLDKSMDKEVWLGYITHLIEDYIWFNKYIPMIAKKIENGKVLYTKDGSINTEEQFRSDIYTDYSITNKYLIQKLNNVDINDYIKQITRKNDEINHILDNIVFEDKDTSWLKLLKKEILDNYIEDGIKEVEKFILKYKE